MPRFALIREESARIENGGVNGWTLVTTTDRRRRRRAHALQEAVVTIIAGLKRASGARAHYIVFNDAIGRSGGGHTHTHAVSWAEGLQRFLITINQIRMGGSPSRPGTTVDAPTPISAHMVSAAVETWNRLTDSQQRAINHNDNWANSVGSFWEIVGVRFQWGMQRIGSDSTIHDVDNGRFRHPNASVY